MKNSLNYNKIARYVAGEYSEEEASAFESGLDEDPELSKVVKEFQKIWETKKNRRIDWDVDSAWQHFNEELNRARRISHDKTDKNKPLHKPTKYNKSWIYRSAAVFMVIVLTGLFAVLYLGDLEQEELVTSREVITEKGQRVQVQLDDGSRIHLNSDSKIIYPVQFESDIRSVQLSGEAYFDVFRDNKPFLVRTDGVTIEILGTEFNVRAYGEESIQVVVAEGKVRVLPTGKSDMKAADLERGDMAKLNRSGDEEFSVLHDVDLHYHLGWLEYRLTFDEANMAQVVRQLERWYGIEIWLSDPVIADMTLTANFEDEPVHEVLRVIKLALNLEYKIQGREITFYLRS